MANCVLEKEPQSVLETNSGVLAFLAHQMSDEGFHGIVVAVGYFRQRSPHHVTRIICLAHMPFLTQSIHFHFFFNP